MFNENLKTQKWRQFARKFRINQKKTKPTVVKLNLFLRLTSLPALSAILMPVRLGVGIGVKEGKPPSACETGSDIVGDGEAEVVL